MTHPLRQHIEEIISLTDEEFDFVLSHFVPINRRKHQYIVQEGEIVNKRILDTKRLPKKLLC